LLSSSSGPMRAAGGLEASWAEDGALRCEQMQTVFAAVWAHGSVAVVIIAISRVEVTRPGRVRDSLRL